MAMETATGTDLFTAANSATDTRRAQIAQYAMYQAAKALSEGKNEEALRGFRTVLAFDSSNETARTYLGKIYQSEGKMSEAIAEFKKAVQMNTYSVDARNNLGSAYFRDKQYQMAEEEFKFAARMDPSDPVADYTLGIMYTEMERFRDAESQFKKVAARQPGDGNVPYSMGVMYNKMGRPEAAAEQLERALKLKPDFAAANYELGAAYVSLGETEKAEKQLEILATKDIGLANDLLFLLEKPRIVTIDESDNISFNSRLGGGTPLWMLDPLQLSTPNASVRVAVSIQFSNDMDPRSVLNPSNWDISRSRSTKGGYYNYMMPVGPDEVTIPNRPLSITYDPSTRQAKVFFLLNQNGRIDLMNGNRGATIDPSHLVFKFSGVDAAGRKMDTTGDQVTGYSMKGY